MLRDSKNTEKLYTTAATTLLGMKRFYVFGLWMKDIISSLVSCQLKPTTATGQDGQRQAKNTFSREIICIKNVSDICT